MRWKLERPLTEKDYRKTRVIEKFLWFPRKVDYETRWLEKAMIEQKVDFDIHYDTDCPECYSKVYFWQDVKWVDPPINLK